jgi:DNA polymerase IV (DinB-like DNA polymerase)
LNRVIGHLDLDYFYAQVEEIENPSLKGIPVLVCVYSGRTENSGVVSTANYKARKLGIKSGMPIFVAKKKLADTEAVILPVKFEKYKTISDKVMILVKSKVDTLEKTGIDEAFFDITNISKGEYDLARAIALDIKQSIFQVIGLTCSIGIAPNKVTAKIASDIKKPDGLTIVKPKEESAFLYNLSVDKLYGVGIKTAKILALNGITTISQLAETKLEVLEELFDRKLALYLNNASNGTDNEPVVEREEVTQISRIITLKKNSRDIEEIFAQLIPIMKDVHEKVLMKKLFFRSISITGVLTDLSIKTKNKTLEIPTNDFHILKKNSYELLKELVEGVGDDLRRAGIRVSDLTNAVEQGSLSEYMV